MTTTARPLVALDLDRTLIYSAAAGGGDPDHRLVERYDGAPASWMTRRAWQLLEELMERAEVVAVTTRSTEQYRRVVLPRRPHHALCSNGGTLLVHGVPDEAWRTESLATAAAAAPLTEARAVLEAVAGEHWVRTVRDVEGLFCYLVAHSRAEIPAGWLREVEQATERAGWTTSLQGRKVYLVPAGVDKAGGVRRLRTLLGPTVSMTLAAGDSLLDAGMLLEADRAVRPAHGELHDLGWEAPKVEVTTASGIAAGEELLAWALARLDDPVGEALSVLARS